MSFFCIFIALLRLGFLSKNPPILFFLSEPISTLSSILREAQKICHIHMQILSCTQYRTYLQSLNILFWMIIIIHEKYCREKLDTEYWFLSIIHHMVVTPMSYEYEAFLEPLVINNCSLTKVYY